MAALSTTALGDAGPRVVFCHGLFGQGRNWTQIGKQLADDHRVLLVDLPNHGASAWFDDVDLVRDADLVARELGEEPVTLVGHSMGGKVAMLVALRHPHLVAQLCVVDVSPVAYRQTGEFEGYIEAMRALDLARVAQRSDADEALTPAVRSPMVRGFLLQNLRREQDSWRWQLNLKALGSHLERIGGWPQEGVGEAPSYEGPVLWLAGARSDYVQDDYVPAMEALFPRVRRVTVKEAGHWVHSEQPKVFVEVLRRFLSARPDAAGTPHGGG